MSNPDLVNVTREGAVLLIEMRRESKRNAVNRELADSLDAAFNRLDDDPTLGAGVLTGTPDVFSAGSDLTGSGDYYTERGGAYGIITRSRTKPLLAAVEGVALGGGMEIVLACDLVVAARTARFGLPEVARGLIPTCGGLFRSPRALPLNVARELLLLGEPLGAERLYHLGFVNVLTEPGEAVPEAVAVAQRICRCAPTSVRASMRALERVVAGDDAASWEVTEQALEAVMASPDVQEGVAAFLEKRQPRWSGS